MTRIRANGLEIEVDDRGPAGAEPVLLVMGLGMQLTAWPEPFVAGLAGHGLRVVRFDNRDIGLSSRLEAWGRPNVIAAAMKFTLRLPVRSAYSLDDMADDTVGVLDALAIDRAHLVGVSMGGMISQIVAARRPERIASFTCIMSTSGARHLPGPPSRVRRVMMAAPRGRAALDRIVDHQVEVMRAIGSPGFPTPPEQLRAGLRLNVERSHSPVGTARQLVAIIAGGDRSRLLRTIRVPTLVLHGADDPLVPVAAAHDLADKIPGARLQVIEGMGHDLAPGLIPLLLAPILAHVDAHRIE